MRLLWRKNLGGENGNRVWLSVLWLDWKNPTSKGQAFLCHNLFLASCKPCRPEKRRRGNIEKGGWARPPSPLALPGAKSSLALQALHRGSRAALAKTGSRCRGWQLSSYLWSQQGWWHGLTLHTGLRGLQGRPSCQLLAGFQEFPLVSVMHFFYLWLCFPLRKREEKKYIWESLPVFAGCIF